jgi:hypothetical protein
MNSVLPPDWRERATRLERHWGVMAPDMKKPPRNVAVFRYLVLLDPFARDRRWKSST